MKLHRLLQKCSFFLIKLAAVQARGGARMKLHQVKSEPQNRRISNIECRRVESLRSVFYKMDRSTQKLTTGGIHYSTFDVGRSMFISFFFDLTGRSRPAATLI
jgi:hypothetical protein